MRTIKFRGQKQTNGVWVYGDLETKLNRIHKYDNDGNYAGFVNVNQETIGQFTGLYDKNGKEIYEGDIVEFYKEDTYCINPDCEPHLLGYGSCIHKETLVVKFSDCAFVVDGKYGSVSLAYCGFNEEEIVELKAREEREEDYFDANGYEIGDSIIGIKVIGNIYDNPNII